MRVTRNITSARRRGSVYVFVLTTAMLISVIGLSAIAISRINTRSQTSKRQADAMALAASAVEAAVTVINLDPGWRFTHQNGVETPPIDFGPGTISWKLVDPDGNLGDDPTDPVSILGIGRCGQSVWAYGVIVSGTDPLEVLNTSLHARNLVLVKSGKSIRCSGAPLSTNGPLQNDGTIYGDVEAFAVIQPGNITGTLTVPSPRKVMPPPVVFGLYTGRATLLPYSGNIDKDVLAPGYNSYGGGLNPDGVYFIDTGGNDLDIRDSRIHGTLIVRTQGRRVTVNNSVFLHNYRPDHPVLMVDGHLELMHTGTTSDLSEADRGTNYNPPGAPYQGDSDTDQLDTYPNEVRGLVHVRGNLLMRGTARVRGVIICDASVTIDDSPEIIHDPSIPQNPPEGYTSPTGELVVAPGTWKRVAVP